MTDCERAYIAGFVDGEGCLTISDKELKDTHGLPIYTFAPSVSITNTNVEVLQFIRDKTNLGKITSKPRPNKRWRLCFQLTLKVDEIPAFINVVLPFLLVKRKQAEVMLGFFKIKGHQGDKDVSEDTFKKRLDLAYKIQNLNQGVG